jgi:hypothetical protein
MPPHLMPPEDPKQFDEMLIFLLTLNSQPIVIDGKGHLMGRLASIVAKQVRFLDFARVSA